MKLIKSFPVVAIIAMAMVSCTPGGTAIEPTTEPTEATQTNAQDAAAVTDDQNADTPVQPDEAADATESTPE